MKPKAGFLRSIKYLNTCSHFNQQKNEKTQITSVRNESDITIDLTDIKRTIKKLFTNTDEMDKSLEKYKCLLKETGNMNTPYVSI